MDNTQEIVDRLAELTLCFPSVAPQLTMNLELDRDPYFGFDNPTSRLIAKHQVPFLLETYVKIGAFVRDRARNCGLRPAIQVRISTGSKMTKDQAGTYFRDFANNMADKIVDGKPFKMAAFSVALTPENYERVYERIAPTLREISKEPVLPGAVSTRIIFGTTLETYAS